MFDVSPHIEEVTAMVRSASALALDWFRQPLAVENKGSGQRDDHSVARFDPVTAADRAVEDALRAALLERFPDHAVLGEERGTTGTGNIRWVIDPIDGTRAFIAGQPLWGTILGLQHDDTVIAGWMHQPTLDHTYVAWPDGAELYEGSRRQPLKTSTVTAVSDAIVLCTHPDMFETPGERAAWGAIEREARLTRYGGDCVNYGYVASGHADLVVENGLQPYDIIPLIPIIERAGGVITDRQGRPPISGGWAVAAATPELHHEALAIINREHSIG